MFFHFSHIMKDGSTYGMILFFPSDIHHMGNHGTEYCHVQGMSGEIILPASQILVEIDFLIQVSVIADDHICDGLGTVLLSGLQDTILFLFDGTDRLNLKPFELQVLLSQWWKRFCRFQYIDTDQSEITNTFYCL